MDSYQQKYLERIKKAQNDDDLQQTIDKIYEDGFQDGKEKEE
ncbi:MAG: hypothetical protein ACMXYA_01475 [Candidatus Woesearchaeota archaeon]